MARTLFIVSRRHADLYAYLRERFAEDEDVDIILDRRVSERRERTETPSGERRSADRRRRSEVDQELRTRSHAILTIP